MQDKGDKISDLGVASPEFGGEAVGTQKFLALAQPLAKLAIGKFCKCLTCSIDSLLYTYNDGAWHHCLV